MSAPGFDVLKAVPPELWVRIVSELIFSETQASLKFCPGLVVQLTFKHSLATAGSAQYHWSAKVGQSLPDP